MSKYVCVVNKFSHPVKVVREESPYCVVEVERYFLSGVKKETHHVYLSDCYQTDECKKLGVCTF